MIRTPPPATCCQNGCTPRITNPFWRTAGMNTPTTVPSTVPMPPNRLAPPGRTARGAARETPPNARPQHRPVPAEQAGAAEDDGGDRGQVVGRVPADGGGREA